MHSTPFGDIIHNSLNSQKSSRFSSKPVPSVKTTKRTGVHSVYSDFTKPPQISQRQLTHRTVSVRAHNPHSSKTKQINKASVVFPIHTKKIAQRTFQDISLLPHATDQAPKSLAHTPTPAPVSRSSSVQKISKKPIPHTPPALPQPAQNSVNTNKPAGRFVSPTSLMQNTSHQFSSVHATPLYNNQSLLFESHSTFGVLQQNMRRAHHLSPSKSISIPFPFKRSSIEYSGDSSSHFFSLSSHSMKRKKVIPSFSLPTRLLRLWGILGILCVSLVTVTYLYSIQQMSSARSPETYTINSISILRADFAQWAEQNSFSGNGIETPLQEVPLWVYYYLNIPPNSDNTRNYCTENASAQTLKAMLYEFIDLQSCTSLFSLSETNTEQQKQKEVGKYLVFQDLDASLHTDYSLTYTFGAASMDEVVSQFDSYISQNIAVSTLKYINSLDALIAQESNINGKYPLNNTPSIYFVEASRNYRIDIAPLLTFAQLDSQFGTQTDNHTMYTHPHLQKTSTEVNINQFASFYSRVKKLPLCTIAQIYTESYSCEEITQVYEKYNLLVETLNSDVQAK